MEHTRRSKRQRVAVDYARLDTSGFADCIRVQHKKLARAVVKFTGQAQEEAFAVSTVAANELASHVHLTGFANPCVVRAADNSRSALGIRFGLFLPLLHYHDSRFLLKLHPMSLTLLSQ